MEAGTGFMFHLFIQQLDANHEPGAILYTLWNQIHIGDTQAPSPQLQGPHSWFTQPPAHGKRSSL